MIRGFRQIASLTLASRILGMLRDVAYGYYFGAGGLMDAWTIAFRIPNLARRMFGEGAAAASFIPVYSEQLEQDRPAAMKLANTVVTVIFLLLSVIVLLGWLCIVLYRMLVEAPDDTKMVLNLTSVMLPYMVMICTVAILGGILNVHRHFAAPAAAPIVLNVLIIGALIVTSLGGRIGPRQQVYFVALAVLCTGILQMAMQMIPLRRHGVLIRPAWQVQSQAFRKILWLMGPMILGLTATQLNTLADDVIAWVFSGSEDKGLSFVFFGHQVDYPLLRGSVSHLYYSQRLYQFPLGVLGISLATAIFPVMSANAARKDFNALLATTARGLGGAVFIALPAIVGLILVNRPLVAILFEHGQFTPASTRAVAWTLSFYALGLCGYFSQQIVTRAYYSTQDSRSPAITAAIAVLVNLCLNLTLIWPMGTAGLAASTAICSYLQVTILLWGFRKRYGSAGMRGLLGIMVKSFVAAVIMGGVGCLVLWIVKNWPQSFGYDLARLGIVVPTCGIVYALLAKTFSNPMLQLIIGNRSNRHKETPPTEEK
ncbi:MAG: murein biosynthesis integral membrane protein MurJ [Sedimentisphaerales bacterium]|nr:murein biosynthesis integral membrane protein MurJ [Sedimentisphaerales bacterium]